MAGRRVDKVAPGSGRGGQLKDIHGTMPGDGLYEVEVEWRQTCYPKHQHALREVGDAGCALREQLDARACPPGGVLIAQPGHDSTPQDGLPGVGCLPYLPVLALLPLENHSWPVNHIRIKRRGQTLRQMEPRDLRPIPAQIIT